MAQAECRAKIMPFLLSGRSKSNYNLKEKQPKLLLRQLPHSKELILQPSQLNSVIHKMNVDYTNSRFSKSGFTKVASRMNVEFTADN